MSTADSAANVVNTWFSERLASGALARDTPAYNQVVSALPDLISRLAPPSVPDTVAESAPDEAEAFVQSGPA